MRYKLIFFFVTLHLIVIAQTEDNDSTIYMELQEIVIQAPKVIHKADIDVYHPSTSAVENSKKECSC